MLKATGTVDGRPTIFLGLSRKNLERFMAQMGDTYILVRREKLGIRWDIMIFSDETEGEMKRKLAGSIGPNTVIHDEPPEA